MLEQPRCPICLPAPTQRLFLQRESPAGVARGSPVPGDRRGFGQRFVPEGGTRGGRGGAGLGGWPRWLLPPQTGLWAFPLRLLRPRAAKLSLPFPRLFLTPFLAFSSPLSSPFPPLFPRLFLTPFLALSSPCLYANHILIFEVLIPGEVSEFWLHTCCFSPACPCPLSQPLLRDWSCHWWPLGLSESRGVWDFSCSQPRNDQDLTKQPLWLSLSSQSPSQECCRSHFHPRTIQIPLKTPPGHCQPGALWLCLVLGWCFFPWLGFSEERGEWLCTGSRAAGKS